MNSRQPLVRLRSKHLANSDWPSNRPVAESTPGHRFMPNRGANIVHGRALFRVGRSESPESGEGVQTKALAKRMQFNQC